MKKWGVLLVGVMLVVGLVLPVSVWGAVDAGDCPCGMDTITGNCKSCSPTSSYCLGPPKKPTSDPLCSGGSGCWLGGTDCPPGAVRTETLLYRECLNYKGACIGTAQTLGKTQCSGTTTKNRYTFACCATEPLTTKPALLYPADGGKVSGLTAELTWEGLTS